MFDLDAWSFPADSKGVEFFFAAEADLGGEQLKNNCSFPSVRLTAQAKAGVKQAVGSYPPYWKHADMPGGHAFDQAMCVRSSDFKA